MQTNPSLAGALLSLELFIQFSQAVKWLSQMVVERMQGEVQSTRRKGGKISRLVEWTISHNEISFGDLGNFKMLEDMC